MTGDTNNIATKLGRSVPCDTLKDVIVNTRLSDLSIELPSCHLSNWSYPVVSCPVRDEFNSPRLFSMT